MRNDLDLALALLGDLDDITEVADTAIDLDLVLEELLEGGDIEDLVGRRLGGVDDELLGDLGLLALRGFLDAHFVLAYCITPRRHLQSSASRI